MPRRTSQTVDAPPYPPTPWYAEGLRFECSQCGDCCSGAGFVWVEDEEIAAMANAMQMTDEQFRDRFTRQVGARVSLTDYPDGDCIFLEPDTRRCLVYQARPVQCRTWPFWDRNLATRDTWRATCQVCPGSGRGRLVPLEEIEIRRKEKSV